MDPVIYAQLSLQRGLLGAVTPNLRAVYIDVDKKTKKLFISFFYDGEITDAFFDIASTAIAEVDIPGYYELDEKIERLDFPEKIPVRGHLVYLRQESGKTHKNLSYFFLKELLVHLALSRIRFMPAFVGSCFRRFKAIHLRYPFRGVTE